MLQTLLAPVVALALAAATLSAQDVTCIEAGDKSPTTARVAGIVPGAGHIYSCEFLPGLGYFVGTTGIILIGTAAAAVDCLSSLSDNCGRSADVAIVVAAGLWAWSIYDAGRAAQRTNAKRRLRVSLIMAPGSSGWAGESRGRALKVGLSVTTR
jgi:hypothetical protein